jgi:hypothetical protein
MIDYGSRPVLARACTRRALIAGVLPFLAACSTPGTQPTSAQDMAAAMTQVASVPPAEPPLDQPLSVPFLAVEPPPAPETVTPPEPPPPPPLPTPTDAQSLRAAFGAPALIRREPDAELWRYDGMGCTAFFFLYPDGGTYRIRHSETSPRGSDMPADPDCLRSLLPPSAAALPAGGM